jgi:hypothetical protein
MGARREQGGGQLRALVGDVLAVVEDEKQVTFRQVPTERLGGSRPARDADLERARGLARDVRRLGGGGEVDEPDAGAPAPQLALG